MPAAVRTGMAIGGLNWCAALVAALGLLSSSLPAHAEDGAYAFSLRGVLGVGAQGTAPAGRLGVAGEYWFMPRLGLGLLGTGFSGFGMSEWTSGAAIAPTVSLRSSDKGSYFIGTIGVGYALWSHTKDESPLICWDSDPCTTDEKTVVHHSGAALHGALGWLGHPGRGMFEIGPVARVDLLADPRGKTPLVTVYTLNLERARGPAKRVKVAHVGKSGFVLRWAIATASVVAVPALAWAQAGFAPRPSPQYGASLSHTPYDVSVRPTLGLGMDPALPAIRLGLSTEYWLTPSFGLGLSGFYVLSIVNGSFGVAPTIELRSAPRGGYFMGALGLGLGWRIHRSCCLDQDSYDDPSYEGGYAFSLAAGWLGHPGNGMFEIGPVLRVDVVGDPRFKTPILPVYTLNLELGGAKPKGY